LAGEQLSKNFTFQIHVYIIGQNSTKVNILPKEEKEINSFSQEFYKRFCQNIPLNSLNFEQKVVK
jgi:hypothetical protein